MGEDIPYIWYDRTVWAIGAQPNVQNFNNPTTPSGGKAFSLIGGAIWPTQIWLGSTRAGPAGTPRSGAP